MEKYINDSLYFKNLDPNDRRAILRCFNARITQYKKGENIVHIADEATNVYIIASGTARSYSIDESGKEYINAEFGKDDVFGTSYINNDKILTYNEYLVALSDVYVIICDGFRFLNPCENRCKRHIDCMRLAYSNLTRLLISGNYRIKSMCQSKTKNKILAYLNQFKSKKKYFTIPYNQTELASYLGLERSALSVELNKLKKDGIIDFDGNTYHFIKKSNKRA